KMKKLVCGLVGAVAAINSVSALTTEEIKQRCMNADNRVWDAKNQKCISKTPCKDSAYAAYCNTTFKDVQVANSEDAKKLVDIYLKKHGSTCETFDMSKAGVVGNDYIRCHMGNGGYIEFEFDDYSESVQHTANYGFAKGLCLIYEGSPEKISIDTLKTVGLTTATFVSPVLALSLIGDPVVDDRFLSCQYVSEADCKAMYSGQAEYIADGKICLPSKDFVY
ncbi:MAG: hypothetical protein ACLRFJ_02770, partial [Alphaproteobacteria bacterium]